MTPSDKMPSSVEKVPSPDKITVRSVERALDILSAFIGSEKNLSLTEIANKVDLHKSTVHRLLNSLEARGYVEKLAESERYRLGNKIIELSSHAARSSDLIQTAVPEMTRLRDELGETVSLYILDRHDRIRLHAIEGTQTVRRIAIIGQRLPLYAGASSKILLAFLPEQEQDKIFKTPYWSPAIDIRKFRQTFEGIRKNQYATSFGEREPGVASIAAPVFFENGTIAAALSISGPIDRFTEKQIHYMADIVIASANRITTMLAHNHIVSHNTYSH